MTGEQAPVASAQLRILNLVGALELDVCLQGDGAVPVARATPAWGLSRFAPWSPFVATGSTGTWLSFRIASAPACHGAPLGAVPLRLAARGAWTLVALPGTGTASMLGREESSPALRVMLLDEGSLLPARVVPLPVRPPPAIDAHR